MLVHRLKNTHQAGTRPHIVYACIHELQLGSKDIKNKGVINSVTFYMLQICYIKSIALLCNGQQLLIGKILVLVSIGVITVNHVVAWLKCGKKWQLSDMCYFLLSSVTLFFLTNYLFQRMFGLHVCCSGIHQETSNHKLLQGILFSLQKLWTGVVCMKSIG